MHLPLADEALATTTAEGPEEEGLIVLVSLPVMATSSVLAASDSCALTSGR